MSNSLRTADVFWVKGEPKNASAPPDYVSKDTREIIQLGNFLLKSLFGNMDTLVSFFEYKGT